MGEWIFTRVKLRRIQHGQLPRQSNFQSINQWWNQWWVLRHTCSSVTEPSVLSTEWRPSFGKCSSNSQEVSPNDSIELEVGKKRGSAATAGVCLTASLAALLTKELETVGSDFCTILPVEPAQNQKCTIKKALRAMVVHPEITLCSGGELSRGFRFRLRPEPFSWCRKFLILWSRGSVDWLANVDGDGHGGNGLVGQV